MQFSISNVGGFVECKAELFRKLNVSNDISFYNTNIDHFSCICWSSFYLLKNWYRFLRAIKNIGNWLRSLKGSKRFTPKCQPFLIISTWNIVQNPMSYSCLLACLLDSNRHHKSIGVYDEIIFWTFYWWAFIVLFNGLDYLETRPLSSQTCPYPYIHIYWNLQTQSDVQLYFIVHM